MLSVMSKWKIFLWHLATFAVGSAVIIAYFWYTVAHLPPERALAGVALLVVAVVYVAGFGILCLISCLICTLVSWWKKRSHKSN
jgi:Na+/H+ antiporter NhaA